MAVFYWGGGSANAGTVGSWKTLDGGGTLTVASAVPGAADSAVVDVAGTLLGNFAAQTLDIAAAGVTLDATTTIGVEALIAGGAVSVGAGDAWTDTGALVVGQGLSGGLTISGGGAVNAQSIADIGLLGGATGTVEIDAGSTLATGGSADIGSGLGGRGAVTLTGAGALWTAAAALYAGHGTGSTGALDVANGASLHTLGNFGVAWAGAATATIESGGVIASNGTFNEVGGTLGGAGAMTVTGLGSQWALGGALFVGYDGIGTLDIAAGGAALSTAIEPNGTATILAGLSSGATGEIVVGAGAQLSSGQGSMALGVSGSGTLIVQGGTVAVSNAEYTDTEGALNVGSTLSATPSLHGSGAIAIDGAGSLLTADGPVRIGNYGSGTLSLSNGGTLTDTGVEPSNTPNINIGREFGAFGAATVASGALLDSGAATLVVGGAGTGTLLVQGGTVTASNSGYTGAVEAGIVLGWIVSGNSAQPGNGFVTVDGPGSVIRSDGPMWVGENGVGQLTIDNTGTVAMTAASLGTVGAVVVGDQAGATGALLVSGAQSLLDAGGGRLSIGNSGTGDATIDLGGTVYASATLYAGLGIEPAVRLGQNPGGAGTLTVDGAGSTLNADGALWVAQGGQGVLTVSNGAMVSAGGIDDGGSGLIVSEAGGSGTILLDGGTLAVLDDAQVQANGGIALSAGGVLSVAGTLSISSGGQLTGAGLVDATVLGLGAITASGGTLELTGPVGGGALPMTVQDGATLRLDAVDNGASVTFPSAGAATLDLQAAQTAGVIINTFATGNEVLAAYAVGAADTIVIAGGTTFVNLFDGGTQIGSVDFTGLPNVQFNPATGAITTVACFAEGTRIATPGGWTAVEDLRAGGRVRAGRGVQAVAWTGHRRVDCRRHPRPWDVQPVRVAAHAFGPGRPVRDLWLSPDHAVLAGGALIPIRYLVNGGSVARMDVERVTYWHVELPRHAVLRAEGLACESYLDTGNRSAFAGGGVVQAHPAFSRAVWAAQGCAPLALDGPRVAAARARLIARLPRLGHAVTADPGLRLFADGREVAPQWFGDTCTVALPDGAQRLTLASRTQRPADLDPASRDTRMLGVALLGLALDGAAAPLDGPGFGQGWLPPEAGLRWTAGAAEIGVRGASVAELRFGDWHRYLVPRDSVAMPSRKRLSGA